MKKAVILSWLLVATFCLIANDSVVENGMAPKDGKRLVFKEDLRIGPDSGENIHFWKGATISLEVGPNGHMFVTDPGEDRVLEFDEKGGHVKTHGGRGEGPGEFRNLASFQLVEGGAVALDNTTAGAGSSRFNWFNQDYTFKSHAINDGLDRLIKSATFSPNGKFMYSLFVTVDRSTGKIHQRTGILTPDRKIVQMLSDDIQDKFDGSRIQESAYWSEMLADRFKAGRAGMGRAAFGTDGTVYTATMNEYAITKWDANMKKQLVIKRNYKPIGQSEKEIMASVAPLRDLVLSAVPANFHKFVTEAVVAKGVELAEIKAQKHPVFALVAMEDKGVIVIHDFEYQSNEARGDVFDANGKFIATCDLPKMEMNHFWVEPIRLVFRNGKAYSIETDDDGDYWLVRYTYSYQ